MKRIIFIAVFCLMVMGSRCVDVEAAEKLIYEKNSLYQYISVIDDTLKKERYVRNQKREYSQGGIYLNAPDKLLFEFTQLAFVSLAFLDREPEEVLFVGLGAGAMPKYFNRYYPEAHTDVVEIDPDMVDVARKYFYFKENDSMKVHVNDGRIFVKRSKKKYDLISLDAYQNDYIPFHLTTVEFLKEVKSRLRDDGVVVSNITSPFRNKFFDSMIMTYKKVFPHLYIFKGRKSGNFIFVATAGKSLKDQESIEARAAEIQAFKKLDIDLQEFAERYENSSEYEWKGAKVLTDDFAPVNLYQHQKSGAQ
jgi:spermidine synthase